MCKQHETLSLAMHLYHDTNEAMPPGQDNPAGAVTGWRYEGTWAFHMLPYVEQTNAKNEMPGPSTNAFTSAAVEDIHYTELDVFNCPSEQNQSMNRHEGVFGNYVLCGGDQDFGDWYVPVPMENRNGIAHMNSETSFRDVSDGQTNTLLMSEVINVNGGDDKRGLLFFHVEMSSLFSADLGPNTSAGDRGVFCFDAPRAPCSNSGSGLIQYARSMHDGGVNAAAVDASVHYVNENVDIVAWRSMGTVRGGEVIAELEW